jgi:hypothetical protein
MNAKNENAGFMLRKALAMTMAGREKFALFLLAKGGFLM